MGGPVGGEGKGEGLLLRWHYVLVLMVVNLLSLGSLESWGSGCATRNRVCGFQMLSPVLASLASPLFMPEALIRDPAYSCQFNRSIKLCTNVGLAITWP